MSLSKKKLKKKTKSCWIFQKIYILPYCRVVKLVCNIQVHFYCWILCSEFHHTTYFSEVAHHVAGWQSWCRSNPLIFYFSLDLPLFCLGTFSVDILVWGLSHMCVMKIGLFACLISANQSFAWPGQQLIIFMVCKSVVHNCLCHRSLFSSHFLFRKW